mgnify:CR=1 FL=1
MRRVNVFVWLSVTLLSVATVLFAFNPHILLGKNSDSSNNIEHKNSSTSTIVINKVEPDLPANPTAHRAKYRVNIVLTYNIDVILQSNPIDTLNSRNNNKDKNFSFENKSEFCLGLFEHAS